MSLPPRIAAIYALLGTTETKEPYQLPPGSEARDDGSVFADYNVIYGTNKSQQTDFYAYQHWFKDYPNELIVKVSQGVNTNSNRNTISLGNGIANWEMTFPDNWEASYNPGPPDFQPPPDPNGSTGYSQGSQEYYGKIALPRWHTETEYDFSAEGAPYDYYSQHLLVPKKNKTYQFYPGGVSPVLINDLIASWDISVVNLESQVYNSQTGDYEYYPFAQATTIFKATAKFKIPKDWDTCCWNNGTVIRGKVAIYSVSVETGTLPETGYGFIGMTGTIGDTFEPHSEIDWEVTISDDYDPVEIEIPKVSGKVTFVNDFWITEVVPPGGA